MAESGAPAVLIVGYGNPGRQDDGLGPEIVQELERLRLPGLALEADYQLSIEHAADLQQADRVIFVDAAVSGPEPFELKRLEASRSIEFTSHTLAPEAVLAICRDTYQRAPEALLIAVRGYSFEFAEGLTDMARHNKGKALEFIRNLIDQWREGKEHGS
ncbi:MAG: hydrogenase maturation protease [Spirochaetales bacterium]|nr:hydrogenase maturation protease [Spirochaetales bacterium]